MSSQSISSGGIVAPKSQVQIFLDLSFKTYTIQLLSEDSQCSEVVKQLKSKYSASQAIGGQMSSMGQTSLRSTDSARSQTSTSGLQSDPRNLSAKKTDIRRTDKDQQSKQVKDEYSLFIINTKSTHPILFIRKLLPQDQVLKIYQKSIISAPKEGIDKFKVCFAKQSDVESLMRTRGTQQSHFDEETHVVSQLGKSIINNKTYERKGRMFKKSLNSDNFKERQFVLDKDQLFYYKNEKQKDKNFNLILLKNAVIHILDNYQKKKFCFQIENENRRYILSTKSQYDLDQWVFAIQGQIRQSRDNKSIFEINQSITNREKEIAQNDMLQIQKIFKPKNMIFNPVQPFLLEFINDPFMSELLPNLTSFIILSREKEHQPQAIAKLKEISNQLKTLLRKAERAQAQPIMANEEEVKELNSESSGQLAQSSSSGPNDEVKNYKHLKPEQKILCLICDEDIKVITMELERIEKEKESAINIKVISKVLQNIQRVIKYNYLDDFYVLKKVDLLQIPTLQFKTLMPPFEFSSTSLSIQNFGPKNINIFEEILNKQSQKSHPFDPNLQNQMKHFMSLDRNQIEANLSGIQKVSSDASKGTLVR